jgi:peptide/nickel transport system substrate-binding protein
MRGPAYFVGLILPFVVACAGVAPANRTELPASQGAANTAQKPIVIALNEEPPTLEPSFGSGGIARDYAALLSAFLAYLTPDNQALPYLAAELPSLEKGTWIMLPDGRMETTYRLNRQALWHDGKPVTAHDFVFGHQIRMDPALPTTRFEADRLMSGVRAVDDSTLLIELKETYIWAGVMFGPNFSAVPRHLLEEMYLTAKDNFVNGSHWNRDFVGNGPYKIERWEQGVELTLRAHDGFVLGTPRPSLVILRFIPDGNTIVANLLGGAADLSFYSSLGLSQGQALEEARWQGKVEYWPGLTDYLEFQTRDWGNIQRAVFDIRVRRALVHAVDRRAIVDGLYAGTATVHHVWLTSDDPAFPAVDRAIQKYDYDPRRAVALLQEAGWTRGADGNLREGSGELLTMPITAQFTDIEQKQATAVADNWRALGVSPEMKVMTLAQQRDREFRSKIQGVGYQNRTMRYDNMVWTSDQVTSAENRWRGSNYIGYVNPVLDELWPRVLRTPDVKEREGILVEALRVMTTDAVVNVTHVEPAPMAYRSELTGPRKPWSEVGAFVWNIWEWHWNA